MTIAGPVALPDGSAAAGAVTGLPSWDLSDLYASPESPAIEADLAHVHEAATLFAADYAGKLAGPVWRGVGHRHDALRGDR